MRKIVIVMTYYDRMFQLVRTIGTIQRESSVSYEIVLVDGGSEREPILYRFGAPPFHLISMIKKNEKWYSPVVYLNKGIEYAIEKLGAEIIVIQCAEVFYVGDVLKYVSDNLTEENYISFGTYSIDESNTMDGDLLQKIPQIIQDNNVGAGGNYENAWYNHPQLRGMGYDWCSAITVSNIKKLNGYDERFASNGGVGYSDEHLRARIRMMGLHVDIPIDPFVVHQWHNTAPRPPDTVDPNHLLWHNEISQNIEVKARHIYTKDFI